MVGDRFTPDGQTGFPSVAPAATAMGSAALRIASANSAGRYSSARTGGSVVFRFDRASATLGQNKLENAATITARLVVAARRRTLCKLTARKLTLCKLTPGKLTLCTDLTPAS